MLGSGWRLPQRIVGNNVCAAEAVSPPGGPQGRPLTAQGERREPWELAPTLFSPHLPKPCKGDRWTMLVQRVGFEPAPVSPQEHAGNFIGRPSRALDTNRKK
jgi:hypothetical protein